MSESKEHKLCKMECKNKLSKAHTHNCRSEVPIHRNGAWHLLDLECPSINENFKDCAIECEADSSLSQRESNRPDGLEWKRKNPEGVFLQIESPDELDLSKLKKRSKGILLSSRGFRI